MPSSTCWGSTRSAWFPSGCPRSCPCGALAAVLALALLLWPRPAAVQAKPAEPLEPVVAAAEQAEESLEDLEEAANRENDPKLKELVQKLTDAIEQMKQPGVDVKEALAKLSEMQAAIAAQQAHVQRRAGRYPDAGAGRGAGLDPGPRRGRPVAPAWQVRKGRRPARAGRSQVRPQGSQEPQGEAGARPPSRWRRPAWPS